MNMDRFITMYGVEYGNVNLALVIGEFAIVHNALKMKMVTEMKILLGIQDEANEVTKNNVNTNTVW